MDKSKVFFTNLHTTPSSNLLDKMERLIKRAGIESIDFKDQFVAIKIHFGEPGNLAYLRPNYAARLATLLRSWGAKPFLTDCNTLYVGSRKHALEHIDTAYTNGFSPFSTGCHVIIADGLKGTDEVEVPVEGAQYCPTAKIGRALMDAATTDACLDILDAENLREPVLESLLQAIQLHLDRRAAGAFKVGAVLFSNRNGPLGQTKTADTLLKLWKEA